MFSVAKSFFSYKCTRNARKSGKWYRFGHVYLVATAISLFVFFEDFVAKTLLATNAHERHEKAATGIATRCVLALIPQRAIFFACYICFRRKNDFSGKLG